MTCLLPHQVNWVKDSFGRGIDFVRQFVAGFLPGWFSKKAISRSPVHQALAFTEDRLEVLGLLSSQIAISIENAELYEDFYPSWR